MRDASQLEADSVNSYISSISVDTGMRFYNQRGDGRMTTFIAVCGIIFVGVVVGIVLDAIGF